MQRIFVVPYLLFLLVGPRAHAGPCDTPAGIDLNKTCMKGAPVVSQGQEGDCWAQAVAGARYCWDNKNGGPANYASPLCIAASITAKYDAVNGTPLPNPDPFNQGGTLELIDRGLGWTSSMPMCSYSDLDDGVADLKALTDAVVAAVQKNPGGPGGGNGCATSVASITQAMMKAGLNCDPKKLKDAVCPNNAAMGPKNRITNVLDACSAGDPQFMRKPYPTTNTVDAKTYQDCMAAVEASLAAGNAPILVIDPKLLMPAGSPATTQPTLSTHAGTIVGCSTDASGHKTYTFRNSWGSNCGGRPAPAPVSAQAPGCDGNGNQTLSAADLCKAAQVPGTTNPVLGYK